MRTPQIMLPVILILSTLTSTQALTQNPSASLIYPDLGVRGGDPTCSNVQDLLKKAGDDKIRLTGYQNADLANAIKPVQSAYEQVQKVCTQTQNSASLLEVQKISRSELGAAAKFSLTLASLERQLSLEDNDNPFSTSLISEQARETAQALSGILERVTSESQQGNLDTKAVCDLATRAIGSLNDWLNTLNNKIVDAVNTLNARINTLNGVVSDCVIITATGQYSGNLNTVSKGTGVRTETITVTYNQTFDVVPSVGVGLLGYDMDVNSNQIQLDVTAVTAKDFTVTVTAINGCILKFVHFSYIATITPKSGIYIGTASMVQNDPDLKTFSGSKTKVVPKQLAPPQLSNRKSMAVITAFSQDTGKGKLTRLDVTITGTTLYFITIADTATFSATTTNLFWSGDDASLDSRYLPTVFLGPIASGTGDRTDTSASLDLSRYLAKPEIFIGMSVVDMDNKADGYRMKHIFPGGNHPNYPVNFNTWNSGYNGQSCDGVFLACTYKDNRNCYKAV